MFKWRQPATTTAEREKQFGEGEWILLQSFNTDKIHFRHFQTLMNLLTDHNRLFSHLFKGATLAATHALHKILHHEILPLSEAVHTEMSQAAVLCKKP